MSDRLSAKERKFVLSLVWLNKCQAEEQYATIWPGCSTKEIDDNIAMCEAVTKKLSDK